MDGNDNVLYFLSKISHSRFFLVENPALQCACEIFDPENAPPLVRACKTPRFSAGIGRADKIGARFRYYSLYSLMTRVGLKCEIHACTLECMKHVFMQWYEKKDIEMIERAFQARIDLQYYADRPVDIKVIEETKRYCKEFFIKTKDIISKIRKDDIDQIRNRIRKEL